jgi:hypothetical protein
LFGADILNRSGIVNSMPNQIAGIVDLFVHIVSLELVFAAAYVILSAFHVLLD